MMEPIALGAPMSGWDCHQGMCRTRTWGGGPRRLGSQLGYMDPDLIDFQSEGNGAELDHLTGADFLLRDGFIIDERTVGGLEVADNDTLLAEGDFGMKRGNGRFVDDDVVRWVATHGVQAAPEVEPEWHQQATKMVEVHTPAPRTLVPILSCLQGKVTERFGASAGEGGTLDLGFPCAAGTFGVRPLKVFNALVDNGWSGSGESAGPSRSNVSNSWRDLRFAS